MPLVMLDLPAEILQQVVGVYVNTVSAKQAAKAREVSSKAYSVFL